MLIKLYVWMQANLHVFKGNLGQRQRGATMIEYVLIVAVISIAAIATILLIGPKISSAFSSVNDALPSGSST
jgi:pilus assembly protein Flp/PilA